MLSREEKEQLERFDAVYLRANTPVMLAIEQSVCGCDYGGNSWTTEAEARQMAADLDLAAGKKLLDLGCGSGWPGLYIANATGCDIVLVDLPFNGLKLARERALKDGMYERAGVAMADASVLPFQAATFDAVCHSDLLCCLRQKREVLESCRRVIRQGGKMVFTVISVAPGLSSREYDRAVSNGPEFVETDADYSSLLTVTGWLLAERIDLTLAYAASCRRQLTADETYEVELAALLGREAFDERVSGWRSKLAALADGVLRRELFTAIPAGPG